MNDSYLFVFVTCLRLFLSASYALVLLFFCRCLSDNYCYMKKNLQEKDEIKHFESIVFNRIGSKCSYSKVAEEIEGHNNRDHEYLK